MRPDGPEPGWITARDLAFLIYYYPFQWMVRIAGGAFFPVAQYCAERLSPWFQARERRVVERKMMIMLGISLPDAKRLARKFLRNRVRAALSDLRRKNGIPESVKFVGRERLESALEAGQGVVLLTVHSLAKRECIDAIRQFNRTFVPVVAGARRPFRAHGRLLRNFARSRLLPLQATLSGDHINAKDPDSGLQIARVLREGGLVLMTPDTAGSAHVYLEFMNVLQPVSAGILDLARLTGCAIVPLWASYQDEKCVVEFREPLAFAASGNREEDRRANLPTLLQTMKEQILAHPEQWEFWDRRFIAR